MKKAIMIFIVSAIVLASAIFWLITLGAEFSSTNIFQFGVLFIIVAFAVYIGFKKLGNAKRGEPVEDELSKKVKTKAAAMSYYVSLYWFLVLMYISDKLDLETNTTLGIAILGMAIFWFVFWIYYNSKGNTNE